MHILLEKLYAQEDLTQAEMRTLTEQLISNTLPEAQLSAALIALKIKKITAPELTGLIQVLQKQATIQPSTTLKLMDNCGTGGDHLQTFNISTISAFVLAAGGIKMAKHGNKGVSSRSGSADLLASFGLGFTEDQALIEYQLQEAGIAFLYAPAFHPIMKQFAPIRQALATPTLFNLIGPLLNPYPLTNQLMGTFDATSLSLLRDTLKTLGRQNIAIVHGAHGMDEANLAGETTCLFYQNGQEQTVQIRPEEVGLSRIPISAITINSVAQSHQITEDILASQPSAHLDTVCLNAALGFYIANKVDTIAEGVTFAKQLLRDGAVYDCFHALLDTQKERVS